MRINYWEDENSSLLKYSCSQECLFSPSEFWDMKTVFDASMERVFICIFSQDHQDYKVPGPKYV